VSNRVNAIERVLSEVSNRQKKQQGEAEVRQCVRLELRPRGRHQDLKLRQT